MPLHHLDLTLATPAENLACDEALLDLFEQDGGPGVLRFWEPQDYFVVVGYGNSVATEVNIPACETRNIPILRRCTGGGTVLQGPGCLNYSLILDIKDGPLHSITAANHFIMDRNRAVIAALLTSQLPVAPKPGEGGSTLTSVEVHGCTDLALFTHHASRITRRKFSGNAQRRRKNFLLFHGTFLLRFDLSQIETFLRPPSRQPDYRDGRSHRDFLANLELSADAVKAGLRKIWNATDTLEIVPRETIVLLARNKYAQREWNLKF